MTVTTYENSERGRVCAELLGAAPEAARLREVIILPIPSVAGGKIRGTDIPISRISDGVGEGDAVVGYSLPPPFTEGLRERGVLVFDAALDGEFLYENAALTAEAALGIILSSERRAPRDIEFGIAGYGRIGRQLVNMLLFLGARVRVFTTSERRRLELGEAGISAELLPLAEGASLGVDILINTAPATLFSPESLTRDGGMRIIELASGDNFDEKIKVEKYPALPARVFPESAGRALYRAASRALLGGGYE
ncbi:MAG: hypothetical protein IKA64_07240 [Clostridia bacterium]|nr:hypothetical protein [Clostridia bacterium]